MKVIKVLLGLLVVLAVLVAVGLKNIDALVTSVVEKTGSEVTGTSVNLASTEISINEGRAELNGLRIQNPAGFSDAALLNVASVAIDIDPASLASDVLVIDEVVLSGIDFLAEQKDVTLTNIQTLLDNIQRNTQGSGGSSSASSSDKSEQTFAIRRLVFEDPVLTVVTDEWGDASVQLPDIRLTDLGTAEQGLTAEQLAQRIGQPVLQQVRENMADELKSQARQRAEEKAREAVNKKLNEKLSEEGKEALEQIKGLFR